MSWHEEKCGHLCNIYNVLIEKFIHQLYIIMSNFIVFIQLEKIWKLLSGIRIFINHKIELRWIYVVTMLQMMFRID